MDTFPKKSPLHLYCPPTKLREGNVFCRVSVQGRRVHMRGPGPPPPRPYIDPPQPWCAPTPRNFQTCATWTSPLSIPPIPRTCRNFSPCSPYVCLQADGWLSTEMPSCLCSATFLFQAFEHLCALELVRPADGGLTRTQREYKLMTLLIDDDQLKQALQKYPNCPTEVRQWANTATLTLI